MSTSLLQAEITVPESVRLQAADDVGAFFEPLNKVDRRILADDHVDPIKSHRRRLLLEKYVRLQGKKILEIGCGYGINMAVWIKTFGADGYGVEPASLGFEMSFNAAKTVFAANDLDPARIIDAEGEHLPFGDNSFDIVYSANVLEHTKDPLQVLREAVRVVKPGGIIHMEIPNYLSYFEGHYMLPIPPMWSNRLLAAWVKLFGRDPSFVGTMKLLNPIWCRWAIRRVSATYPVRLLSLGEDVFLTKLAEPYEFETKTVSGRLNYVIHGLQKINFGNWIGKVIVAAQGHYPIYITIRKL